MSEFTVERASFFEVREDASGPADGQRWQDRRSRRNKEVVSFVERSFEGER